MAKLATYKQSKLVTWYQKVLRENSGVDMILNKVEMVTETWTVDKLYWHYNNGLISSLPPYLQRVLLDSVWGANNHKKAKSYIRSIWGGLGCLTPMTIIPIELILDNVEEKIKQTKEEKLLEQFKTLKAFVLKEQKHNVIYINLDGQSRSYCGIVPYMEGKFNLTDVDFEEQIDAYDTDNKQWTDVSIHKYTELQKFQKASFLFEKIAVNIINKGTLKQVSDALIAINSNEKWKEWQQIYNNAEPTLLKYAINEVIGTPQIKDFLEKTLSQSHKYKIQFSGWAWYSAEQLVWLKHLKTIDISFLSEISKGKETSPEGPEIDFVKDMIDIWIKEYNGNNAVNPIHLSTFIAFRDLLKNYNNKSHSFYMCFGKIPETDILSENKFLSWYLDTITKFESKVKKVNGKNILNDAHWVKDSQSNKHSAAPESWPAHCEGGMKLVSITGRLRWLLGEFKNNYQNLINNGTISDQVNVNDMVTIIVANDFEDSDGEKINQTHDEVYEKGHDIAKGNEGSSKLENVKPQKKKSNRSYAKRNMIKKDK
jgi:hypothetical protein